MWLHVLLAHGWSHHAWIVPLLVHMLYPPHHHYAICSLLCFFFLKMKKLPSFPVPLPFSSCVNLVQTSSFLIEKNNLPNLATAPLQPSPCKRHSRQHAQQSVLLLCPLWAAKREKWGGASWAEEWRSLWSAQCPPEGGNCRIFSMSLLWGHLFWKQGGIAQVMSDGKEMQGWVISSHRVTFGILDPKSKAGLNIHTTFFSWVPS